ncbi:GNAT family N-acetyltransferase [Modestobacter sp. VKM Ac-2676]|nr:GNAT family N-acetyltransferase [Modestobacter sp. VKM Ac-2676]
MSTSADRPVREQARLRPVGYADPVAQQLIEQVQQEYVVRYGGRDEAVVDPAEFTPPQGLFLVAEVDGVPAACGGWRVHDPVSGTVELKRMYVAPAFRRRGLAALVLAALERSAADAGHRHLVLNSGDRQPEAPRAVRAARLHPGRGYGRYADSPEAVFLGRSLADGDQPAADGGEDAWAS